MRPSRKRIGVAHAAAAERARLELETERLLETTQGRRLLEACDGDVEHALRVISVVGDGSVPPLASSPPAGNVVRLPRLEPYDWLEDDSLPPALSIGQGWLIAAGLGLAAWLILAAAAFGLYTVVEAIR